MSCGGIKGLKAGGTLNRAWEGIKVLVACCAPVRKSGVDVDAVGYIGGAYIPGVLMAACCIRWY